MREIRMITEKEWKKFVNTPFNPPTPSLSEDEFRKEFFGVEEGLRAILEEYGVGNAYGDGDFYLNNSLGATRGVGFVISEGSRLERPELVTRIEQFLASREPLYDISIEGEECDFYLYISRERIQAFTQDLERLARFGLAPRS